MDRARRILTGGWLSTAVSWATRGWFDQAGEAEEEEPACASVGDDLVTRLLIGDDLLSGAFVGDRLVTRAIIGDELCHT